MTPEMIADLKAIAPEIWLVGTLLVTLIADLVIGKRSQTTVGVLALLGVSGALWALMGAGPEAGPESGRAFGVLASDGFAGFFRTLIISAVGLVILHGMVFRELESATRNEFDPMLIGAALGACLLVSTDHLIMLVLAMEMLSLPSYVLAGWQKRERRSSEAALKYLVYGALASALMVFGFSVLYGVSGSVWMTDVGRAVATQWDTGSALVRSAIGMATVLVFAGFGFKIAAFPFHFWAPDVYEGSPTPVTTMLAVASKAAGFGVLVRFIDAVFLGETISADWLARFGWVMAVLSAVTMTYGNVTAVLQRNVKRLLAYSSIAHAGYLLMGVAAMVTLSGQESPINLGVQSLLFYMATYYFATIGAFGCAMALANRFGVETTDDYQGLGWSAPWTSSFFVIFLVSLTGLPPTVGFIGKFMLFKASLDAGLFWLAIVGALNAAVALFYYLKVVRALFLRGDREPVEGLVARGFMPLLAHASLLLFAVAVVYYGLMFDGLSAWVNSALL